MRRAANWLVVLGLLVGACSSSTSTDLTKLVLTGPEASRAGSEPVTMSAGPGSKTLAGASGATLDQCAPSYPSEAKRKARYQVAYVQAAGRISESNEVVRYDTGGAAQSYAELTSAVQQCALQGGATEFEATPRSGDLMSRQVAFSYRIAQPGEPIYEAVVYQYKGDVLDVVYAFRPDRVTAMAAAQGLAKAANSKLAST